MSEDDGRAVSAVPVRAVRDASAGRRGRLAGLILAVVLTAGCDASTGPEETSGLGGTWAGSGSVFQDVSWTLEEDSRGDVRGEGYMDAPGFLDGYPAGPQPRYNLTGSRSGLFVTLRLEPQEEGAALVLLFRGTREEEDLLKGRVSTPTGGELGQLILERTGAP